jgi:hypothetical protein
MLGEHPESTVSGVADLYIVDFGGGEQERARREEDAIAAWLVGQPGCEHHGARLFCPDCGQRMGEGS